MSKKKHLTYVERRKQDHVNMKAILWTGAVVVALIILMAVLLYVQR